MSRLNRTAVLVLLILMATACSVSQTPEPPSAASLNLRLADLPPGLQPCLRVLDRLKLSSTAEEAAARKQGAVEFSEVDFSTDQVFCSTSENSIGRPIEFAQALLVRFSDAKSAATAYQAHLLNVGVVIGSPPDTLTGSATGFGPNSVRISLGPTTLVPIMPSLFGLDWQKGIYVFKGEASNLSVDQSLHAMKQIYSRVPS